MERKKVESKVMCDGHTTTTHTYA